MQMNQVTAIRVPSLKIKSEVIMKTDLLHHNEIEALTSLKEELEKNFRLIDLRIFGSKARGNATEDSDIDVMIELEYVTPSIEEAIDMITFKINLKYDCLISSVIYSQTELTDGPMGESPLYKVIEREGIGYDDRG